MMIVLISLILTYTCNSLTASPAFHRNDKFFETASYSVLSTTYYGQNSWDTLSLDKFNFMFGTTHATYRAQVAIQSIDYQINNQNINITVDTCNQLATHLEICLYSSTLSRLKGLTLRLILFQGGVNIMFHTITYSPSSGPTSMTTVGHIEIVETLPIQNLGTPYVKFCYFMGMNVTAPTSDNYFDLRLTVVFLSWTLLQVKINTQVLGTTLVHGLKLGFFGYNVNDMISGYPAARAQYYNYQMTLISSFINSFASTPLAGKCQTFNTFWGIYRFRIGRQPFLMFNTTLNPLVSIPAASTYVLNNLYLVVYSFQIKACENTTPYYMVTQAICYDICPQGYYGSNVNYQCTVCPYECQKCNSNGQCTQCNSVSHFRALVNGRCVPLDGYFDNGLNNSVAQPCSNLCRTCTNSPSFCTGCFTGSILSSTNTCITCPAGYIFYQNACITCPAGYVFDQNACKTVCGDAFAVVGVEQCDDGNLLNSDGCSSSCTFETNAICAIQANRSICQFCGTKKYADSSHTTCLNCRHDCLTCINPNACLSCPAGYILDQNACITVCGDAFAVIGVEQCDDGNLYNGDGCSSSCTFEINAICDVQANRSICQFCEAKKYADSSHTTCLNCRHDCQTCLNPNFCLSCGAISNRKMNQDTQACEPKNGFYQDGRSYIAPQCHENCPTCFGPSQNSCLSCRYGKIVQNGTCLSCQEMAGSNCQSCSSTNVRIVCLSCSSGSIADGRCRVSRSAASSQENSTETSITVITIVCGFAAISIASLVIYKKCNLKPNQVENEMKNMQIQPQQNDNKIEQQNEQKKNDQANSFQISRRAMTQQNIHQVQEAPQIEADVNVKIDAKPDSFPGLNMIGIYD